ncbi:Imm49 family immunity protein [Archangium lansingense]|uniref:Immunity protein 49 of polymorphic toxin system n=1 Tax=Archangium lansingense TaxID=2995310 RepID=A0ABT4AKT4_9BACT|nr:Imm49 family immunity protein [Archangium lansinium]MCY1082304.1 hypothetical protein [Archangium lansinium]
MPDLMALRADAASMLAERMRRFDPGEDRVTLLTQVDAIVLDLQLIAAATLLVDGNTQHFLLNLCRAAENGRRLLELLRTRALAPPPARKNGPLVCALAAGHFALANAVAAVSPTEWQKKEEYEDEFLWARVLQELARQEPPSRPTLEHLLTRLEEVGQDTYASRCGLTRALLSGDRDAFAEHFATALMEYEEETETRARSFATPVTAFAPHRFLWLEGLGLLRLGERAGFQLTETEYRYCPPLARVPMAVQYNGDWGIRVQPRP